MTFLVIGLGKLQLTLVFYPLNHNDIFKTAIIGLDIPRFKVIFSLIILDSPEGVFF
jgi:hypothetical protein